MVQVFKKELPVEGLHNVTIKSVEDVGVVNTVFGLKHFLEITFVISDQRDATNIPLEWAYRVTKSIEPGSRLFDIATKFLGVDDLPSGWNTDDLVGSRGQIVIQHETVNKRVRAQIVLVPQKRGAR